MASVIDIEAASLLKEMAGKGVKVFRAGGSQNRKVTVNSGWVSYLDWKLARECRRPVVWPCR